MKLLDYKNFEIHMTTSGGKAGRGHNETSSIQVRQNNCVEKAFRFITLDSESGKEALKKARVWCDAHGVPDPKTDGRSI